ncbi:domain v domain-containing protein [Cystoisospora suis]|uniref:Domain v domain-containing protein n=1 Tax=Cystoisospora suis TaxID=483139 RepID=A0A2C6LCK4_9APIC|nr:domain v domain-containing protein [Cystoisospora suis]
MIEAASILRNANRDSLVIIDELGRGTSTYEGFGLAWSIARHLASSIQCFCLFATHFHEMSQLAEEVEGVANYHVSAAIDGKKQKLTFLYRLSPGCIDQSYGVHVADFAGLPHAVVERAREKSNELEAVERDEKEISFLREDKKRESQKRVRDVDNGDRKEKEEEQEEKKEKEDEEERKIKLQKREKKQEAFKNLKDVLKKMFECEDTPQFMKTLHEEKMSVKDFFQASAPEFLLLHKAASSPTISSAVA